MPRSWAFLGLGFTMEERSEEADRSPYFNEDVLDPKWMEVTKSGALVADKMLD